MNKRTCLYLINFMSFFLFNIIICFFAANLFFHYNKIATRHHELTVELQNQSLLTLEYCLLTDNYIYASQVICFCVAAVILYHILFFSLLTKKRKDRNDARCDSDISEEKIFPHN